MSVPPPTSAPPATAPELVLALEESRGWRRPRNSDTDLLRLDAAGVSIEHGRVLHAPLELPLGDGEDRDRRPRPGPGGAASPAASRSCAASGPTTVIPRQRGDRGLAVDEQRRQRADLPGRATDEAPNAALLFAKPLDEARLRAGFDPEFVTALAARSPLGSPTVLGVLFRVADTLAAERAFRRWGFQSVLTDKDVPPHAAPAPARPTGPPTRSSRRRRRRRARGDVGRAARHVLTAARYGERP